MVAFSAVAAIQQSRAAAFFSLTQQAAVQFAIIEDDVKTRQKNSASAAFTLVYVCSSQQGSSFVPSSYANDT
jgi:hypothetical protein